MLSELLLQHFKVLGVGPLLLDSIAPFSESGYTLVELLDVHQTSHTSSDTGQTTTRASGIWLGVSFGITTWIHGVNLNRLLWFVAHLTLFPNLVEDF